MAEPFDTIQNIGQKALSVPTDLLNVGAKRMTEDVGMMSSKVQELGTALVPPAGGLALPELPPFPGMPGTSTAGQKAPAETRSETVRGVRKTRKTSYLKV